MEARILNVGLDLAMEFGKNWLQPIQSRLAKKFPALSAAELDECEHTCREAMTVGHAQVPIQWRRAGGDEKNARRLFDELMLASHPWIAPKNLAHLFSQGCYYAAKDGELAGQPAVAADGRVGRCASSCPPLSGDIVGRTGAS